MQVWWSVAVAVALLSVVASSPTERLNDRPIIGILAQQMDDDFLEAVVDLLPSPQNQHLPIPTSGISFEEDIGGAFKTQDSLQNFEYHTFDDGERPQNPKVDLVQESDESNGTSTTEDSMKVFLSTSPESSSSKKSSQESVLSPKDASRQYIAASYVKFVESAGARVVPILTDQDDEYYERILNSINGVLFPGGAVAIDQTSGFGRAGKLIYDHAVRMNEAGDTFPLWGTCLGFEMLLGLAAGGDEVRTKCLAQNSADHVKLDADYIEAHLFRHMPKSLLKALITKPVTANFHHYCITPKNFTDYGVDKIFRPLAYSSDKRGIEYVAMAEARDYPFYAVQFHPEKAPYEWTTSPGHNKIPHTKEAVHLSYYLAQVFVTQARRSLHAFTNATEEMTSLIYNFPPVFTGSKTPLEQIYVF